MSYQAEAFVDDGWRIPDELWVQIEPLLPISQHHKGRQPSMSARQAMDAIFFVLRTGCPWKAIPQNFGASSTIYKRFLAWRQAGVFNQMYQAGLISSYPNQKVHFDQRKGSASWNTYQQLQPSKQEFEEPKPQKDLVSRQDITLQRIKLSFSATYLTLTSIIQAGVLGYLASYVDTKFNHLGVIQWILIINTFLLLVAGWNEYMMGATAFIWMPTLLDAIIPFALGAAELYSIHFILNDQPQWFLGVGITSLVSYFAFLNMFHKAKKNPDDNKAVIHSLGIHKYISEICSLLGFLFMCVSWLISERYASSINVQIVLSTFATANIVVFLARSIFYWRAIANYAQNKTRRNYSQVLIGLLGKLFSIRV